MFNVGSTADSIESLAYSILFRYKDIFFSGFVAIFVGRRILRITLGGKYSARSLVLSPLMYLAFTGATYIGLSTLDLLACSIAFAVGLGLSSVFKNQVKFFEKKEKLHYRRSPVIGLAWTTAFVTRIYLLIYYDLTAGFFLSIILSFLSGLILGEAFQIAIQKRTFEFHQKSREMNFNGNNIPEPEKKQ